MPKKSQAASKSRGTPLVIRSLPALRATVAQLRARGQTLSLVPTMGALHDGHFALVRAARRKADHVFVSIFVNPTQFAPNEDLASYPRTWDADLAALSQLKVDAVWAPGVATMYPQGFSTHVVPGGPAAVGLEDRFRPHFFGGVCTVVAKLLQQVQPDFAMFGEKDFQQLRVVSAMVRDLDMPVRIVGVPTVRERDGLALSSRNRYLSAAERAVAPTLHQVLKTCAQRLRDGHPLATVLTDGQIALERAGFAVDYLEARDAQSLVPLASIDKAKTRLLVAARLGRTRLIDNIAV